MSDKIEFNSFSKLDNCFDLERYFNYYAEKKHKYYFHYTSIKGLEGILKNHYFRISSVNRFNDEMDKQSFGTEKDQRKTFSLCFSSGENENLPLWYLYSGIDGKGANICLTASKFTDLLTTEDIYLTEYDYVNNDPVGLPIKLVRNVNVNISYRDVLYFKKKQNSADLKYNTLTNHSFPLSEFQQYENKYKSYTKGLIWFYEKESRIIVELNNEAERFIKNGKDYAVLLNIPDSVYNQLKIKFAPESDKIEDIIKITDCPHIKDFIIGSSRAYLSDYHGQIKMNLCGKCEKNK